MKKDTLYGVCAKGEGRLSFESLKEKSLDLESILIMLLLVIHHLVQTLNRKTYSILSEKPVSIYHMSIIFINVC